MWHESSKRDNTHLLLKQAGCAQEVAYELVSPAERDALGWPEDFFAATAGQWAGDALVREQLTDYETRLDLA